MGGLIGMDAVVNRPVGVSNNVAVVPISGIACNFTSNNSSFPSGAGGRVFNNNNKTNIAVAPITFLIVSSKRIAVGRVATFSGTTREIIGLIPRVFSGIASIIGGTGGRGRGTTSGSTTRCISTIPTRSIPSRGGWTVLRFRGGGSATYVFWGCNE